MREDTKPTQLLKFLQKRQNFPSEIVILVNETSCKFRQDFFSFIPMYHEKTAHCVSKAIKLWLRAGQQRLKPLMPHSHQQEQRALPPWPLEFHAAALPRQKPYAKNMPGTELYRKNLFFRDHDKHPASSRDFSLCT